MSKPQCHVFSMVCGIRDIFMAEWRYNTGNLGPVGQPLEACRDTVEPLK